jgi:hypothetical protein
VKCVTFIACLVAATGCGSEDKPKPPPPPTDGIELVQPGAQPRRALRYTLAAGTTSALDFEMDVDLTTVEADLKLPVMAMSIDVAVASVDPPSARLKLDVIAAGVRPRDASDPKKNPAIAVMERQAKFLPGLVVTYGLTADGQVKDTKVEGQHRDLSEPMRHQVTTLLQASEQIAMALPQQPVGVGAVWKHRRTIKQNQLTLVSMTTVELTAIDGPLVTFKSTTEMTGPDQTLAQGSASARVTAVRGTGTQTGTFDLAKAIVTGEQTATLSFEMLAEKPRPVKMVMTTRIAPRTDPPPR